MNSHIRNFVYLFIYFFFFYDFFSVASRVASHVEYIPIRRTIAIWFARSQCVGCFEWKMCLHSWPCSTILFSWKKGCCRCTVEREKIETGAKVYFSWLSRSLLWFSSFTFYSRSLSSELQIFCCSFSSFFLLFYVYSILYRASIFLPRISLYLLLQVCRFSNNKCFRVLIF